MAEIKKKGKVWTYRIWYRDEDGKRRSINKSGFRTRPDAIEAASKLETERNHGAKLDKSKIPFASYYKWWIDDTKIGNFSRGTENRYRHTLKLIRDEFGETPLRQINRRIYQKFLNSYAKDHSEASVQKVNSYIRSMVTDAMSEQIIFTDFTKKVQNNGSAGKNEADKFLQEDQFMAVKNLALSLSGFSNISAAEIVFSVLTGARYEEVTAVSWDRIDFEHKTITLDRAYDYSHNTGFKSEMKTPSSRRTIAVNDELLDMLKSLRTQQRAQYLKTGYRDDDQLVFRSRYRTVPTSTSVNQVLKDLQTRVKIPKENQITFHGLRHTHASYLIGHGVQISYVSKRLGHKDVSITMKVYAHLLDRTIKVEEAKAIKLLNTL